MMSQNYIRSEYDHYVYFKKSSKATNANTIRIETIFTTGENIS